MREDVGEQKVNTRERNLTCNQDLRASAERDIVFSSVLDGEKGLSGVALIDPQYLPT